MLGIDDQGGCAVLGWRFDQRRCDVLADSDDPQNAGEPHDFLFSLLK